MPPMARVLVVDDESRIRDVVRFALERAGHEVVEAADGQAALDAFDAGAIDAVVLDILMPEVDGLEVCRRMRANSEVPILFLSSRDDEFDRVLGLEMGADDYLTKPFSPRELTARVKSILRRFERARAAAGEAKSEGATLRHGALAIDRDRRRVTWEQTGIPLTATEFDLLAALAGFPGKVFTRGELVDRAWGTGHHITDRTVDSHVRRLRKKFADADAEPVETVYGVGYRLKDTP